jgi:hypothetical protein
MNRSVKFSLWLIPALLLLLAIYPFPSGFWLKGYIIRNEPPPATLGSLQIHVITPYANSDEIEKRASHFLVRAVLMHRIHDDGGYSLLIKSGRVDLALIWFDEPLNRATIDNFVLHGHTVDLLNSDSSWISGNIE